MIRLPRGEALAATASSLIDQYRKALTLIGFAVATCAGIAIGWKLHGPEQRIALETAKPAIELKAAMVLARDPAAIAPSKIVAAAKKVKGAKLERAALITVKPKQVDCTPLNVELGVLKLKDNTQRIVVRSDGATLGGVDIPLDRSSPRVPKWSAGALVNPIDQTYGAYVDRDLGPFRAGIDLMQDRERGAAIIVRVGVRF